MLGKPREVLGRPREVLGRPSEAMGRPREVLGKPRDLITLGSFCTDPVLVRKDIISNMSIEIKVGLVKGLRVKDNGYWEENISSWSVVALHCTADFSQLNEVSN